MDEIETLGKTNSNQRWQRVSALGLCLGALAAPALAQTPPNLLTNAGFEDNPLPALVCGNNYPKPITPWVMLSGSQTNVIAVDGGANCNYGNSGPALDAQNTPQGTWQHYLDLLATGTVYQTFTVPSCPGGGAAPRTASFSGYFSSRDGSSSGSGRIAIVSGAGAGGAELAAASTTPGGLSYQSWTPVSGDVPLTPGSTFSYVVSMTNPTNFDHASVTLSACPVVSTPTAVPANDPWALLLAAAGVGWLARRRLARQQRG